MNDTLINKTKNELIVKRRRRKRIKNSILLFIFLLAVLFVLSIKLPYFNIKYIKVYGNKSIDVNEIKSLSKISMGNNIFYINVNKLEKNILRNPYIGSVKISRKLPSQININVAERNAIFYIKMDNKFYIVDKFGILLQKRSNIDNMNLVKLNGINLTSSKIGESIKTRDNRKIDGIKNIGSLIEESNVMFGIDTVDFSNSLDIKAYRKDMCIKLGSADDMRNKLNKALNIIEQEKLSAAKGYVDVRFDGNPVFYIYNN
ncbi:FtsQ-type POTRA domain-containing protein [Clostridium tyrobutyricum]|uniref:cell division protein FtsQ/DivIB n=1 Tax=Clostridium tyrobutyricum TaxID=1519 RepID=UPI001C38E5D6|nr:FtsQ-type POTRA domain-containing protein [Clostridium tyrobutyricum]MBV4419107.1 FtsQ-type POTRA domain-containing protein [Clostridium tyrobutyricum]